jgi:Fe2+ or Zn2+ uptake regulation protein
MFYFYLPYAQQFEKLFLENEIYEWEAKFFLNKMNSINENKSTIEPSYIYSALRILLRHKLLSFKRSRNNQRLFLYSETESLKNLRTTVYMNNFSKIIKFEKEHIISNLSSFQIKKEYIYELKNKYPEFNLEIIYLDRKIEIDQKKDREKLKVLENFLNILSR